VDMPTERADYFVCRQAFSAVDRALSTGSHGCRQAFLESRMLCRLAQSVDRPIGLSTAHSLLAFFKLDSKFISDSNLELLVYFSS